MVITKSRLIVPITLLICGLCSAALAETDYDELADMSILELMDVQVTLASRTGQRLADTPAAVHILTQEDIRRSGATSIPELLRLVPGLQVARIDANKWAISSRGFNERFSNKLLVLIDGRTVYLPSFSGLYWEAQDVVLEDIERIEVIRGPGATLWGANAVNGIINVVTKEASRTQGGLLSAAAGIEDRAIVSLRYGGTLGDDRHYRAYAKYTNREAATDTSGNDAGDGWSTMRTGGRLDWHRDEATTMGVEAELLVGDLTNQLRLPVQEQPFFQRQKDDIDVVAGHVQGRWIHTAADLGTWTSHMYYSYHDRQEFIEQTTHTLDFDLQHQWHGGIHQLVWGGGYRVSRDEIGSSLALSVAERSRTLDRLSFFVQDDVALIPERFHVIVGSKIEHDEFTGTEVQPNARLRWTPSPSQTYWSAVSRAVRTPSRGEIDIRGILPNASIQEALLPQGVEAGFASFSGNPQM
jgi:iron complex outermembrane receptor protein